MSDQTNTLTRIDAIHAAVSVDDDGTEGICAFMGPMGWMPMIAADPARLAQILPMAAAIASGQQRQVRIVKFTERTEVAVFDGRQ